MLKVTFLYGLEKTINFLLRRDPNSEDRLRPLENKIITLQIVQPALTIYWLFEHHRVQLLSDWRGATDATIATSLQTLTQLGFSNTKVATDLTVKGDMQAVEAFKELFSHLDIDWEAQLAPFTGDEVAFGISKAVNKARHLLRKIAINLRDNSKDYLQEEVNILPPKLMVTDFASDVRELNRDVDKLISKVKRLEQRAS